MIETNELQRIETTQAPLPIGPYSQAVAAGNLVFCSGQIPLRPGESEISGTGAADQAEVVLANLGAVLTAARSSFRNVVKTTIFLTDMNDFAAVNAVYERFFEGSKPARSTVAVSALPKGARVEVEAVALVTTASD
ncbi:MAG TPA: RidA family protein [Candidatus Baltobacteraceae bacterium]|jgi:2-iminobutanoate/2-iminopropanoate deaminase|nr:RidA family protein [Candidatus Baltobacteraceae bacterium]